MKKKSFETKYAIWNDARGEFVGNDIAYDKDAIMSLLDAECVELDEVSDITIYKLMDSGLKVSSKIHVEEE
jgi:hypothetical protein